MWEVDLGCRLTSGTARRSLFRRGAVHQFDNDRGASDTDFSDLERATRQIALSENQAVFHGFAAGGIGGIVQSAGNDVVTLDDDFEHYPASVARA